MLKAFGRAIFAPIRQPLSAVLATLILVGVPVLISVGLNLTQIVSLAPTQFFAPDGFGDPVLFQHALWLLGGPEGMRSMLLLSMLVFGPLAYAIWWRALERPEVPLRIAAVARVALWLWLALSALILSAVYFALVPMAAPVADTVALNLLTALVVILLARFQPRIAEALGGAARPEPGWALCLGCAVLILFFGLVLQVLATFAWMGVVGLRPSGYRSPDPGGAELIARLRLLDWQPIFFALAFAYAALVAVAFLRAPRG